MECQNGAGTVYPRVCGATVPSMQGRGRQDGLSPRVRGNRRAATASGRQRRSIPACAGQPCTRHYTARITTVYPRVCGATAVDSDNKQYADGLSPRVRGNHAVPVSCTLCCGSIPACAGQPVGPFVALAVVGVYPRVCGATLPEKIHLPVTPGLSPRVRGNRDRQSASHSVGGSIPACAGQPCVGALAGMALTVYPRVCGATAAPDGFLSLPGQVYPRVCGATRKRCVLCTTMRGLSPRVRGNRYHSNITSRKERVYPRVCGATERGTFERLPAPGLSPRVRGNRAAFWGYPYYEGVYPRVCGATERGTFERLPAPGLSPRVRGNPLAPNSRMGNNGSIPRVRGNRRWKLEPFQTKGVYPRVCGATCSCAPILRRVSGLSPRVRGNRGLGSAARIPFRSIPACAGQPCCLCRRPRQLRVYPRVCGATVAFAPLMKSGRGLSPRVRGQPTWSPSCPVWHTVYPACAGQPSLGGGFERSTEVYPRVCGATRNYANPSVCNDGLSPRVRGNPSNKIAYMLKYRSIPACAGQPL